MRSALGVLYLLALAGGSRAEAEGATAIIWKGAKAKAEAEQQKAW
ncbi:hypothetical protein [Myxococcus sp. Y35]